MRREVRDLGCGREGGGRTFSHLYEAQKEQPLHLQSWQWCDLNSLLQKRSHVAVAQ